MPDPTILIVEDNPITRRMLRVTLETAQFTVIEAEDGAAALGLLASGCPALVFQDFILPDMDGTELLTRIRRLHDAQTLPVVLLTGLASKVGELPADDGFATVLLKPVEPGRLIEVVRSLLPASVLPARQAPTSSRRVLVIDDDPGNRKLAHTCLGLAGYTPVVAASVEEGLREARATRPDVILGDVLMPGLDGFQLCLAAHRDPALAGIPIVLVSSAYTDEADRALAIQVGASDLVERTPSLDHAIAAMEAALAPGVRATARANVGVDQNYLASLRRQLDRQMAHTEELGRRAAIQAAALSMVAALSQTLADPRQVAGAMGDVLIHSLDAAGLSAGILYLRGSDGALRLHRMAGLPVESLADAEGFFGCSALLEDSGDNKPSAWGSRTATPAQQTLLKRLGHDSALVVPFVLLGRHFGTLVLASDQYDLADAAWGTFARALAVQFGQTLALGRSLAEMAEADALLRAAVEASPNGMIMADAGGKIVMVNRQSERIFGYDEGGLVGQQLDLLLPARLRQGHQAHRAAYLQNPQLRPMGAGRELFGLHKSGRDIPIEIGLAPVTRGAETLVIASVVDISERKRAEQSLAEQSHAAALGAEVGIAITRGRTLPETLQGCCEALVRNCDAAFARIWTLNEPEQMLELRASAGQYTHLDGPHGRVPVGKFKIGQIASERLPHLTNAVVGDPRVSDQGWAKRERMVAFAGYPLLVQDRLVGVLAMFARHPLTPFVNDAIATVTDSIAIAIERTRAEATLADTATRLRAMMEHANDGIAVLSATGVIREANARQAEILGEPVQALLGRHIAEFVSPDTAPATVAEFEAVVARGTGTVLGVGMRRPDGKVAIVDFSLSTVAVPGERIVLSIGRDVTAQRVLETQVRQAQRMEAIGRLAGGVAHDFNNVLTAVFGNVDLLRDTLADNSAVQEELDEIHAAAERASGLTRQLLAFSRQQVLEPVVLELNQLIEGVEKMLRRVIGEDVELRVVLGDAVGNVRADPGQLQQVVMNLVVNARDAMPTGGNLTLETANADLTQEYADGHRAVIPGAYVMLAVSDTGVGMGSEVQGRIFEPFFTTKERDRGTGLGLSTVYGIVKQSGGYIWVYSELGRGTTFKVYLPRVDGAADQAAQSVDTPSVGGDETILLVEDDAMVRPVVRGILERLHYTVLEAVHCDAGLGLAARHDGEIHLLITDVVMPGASGRELARRLSVVRPGTKVLFVSGYTDDAIVHHGMLEPGLNFLQKPFTPTTLARKVREVLDGQ